MKTLIANLKHLLTHDLALVHKRSDASISILADRTTTLLGRNRLLEDRVAALEAKKDKKK